MDWARGRMGPTMNLDTSMLRAFSALAEHLHFGRAAQALNVAPPKLTRLIQQLEQVTGSTLVNRSTHATALTEAGRRLLPSAHRIVAECDWIARQAQPSRTGASGRFVIGATAGVLYEELPSRIRAGRRRFPEIVCDLVEVDEASLSSRVASGAVDGQENPVAVYQAAKLHTVALTLLAVACGAAGLAAALVSTPWVLRRAISIWNRRSCATA